MLTGVKVPVSGVGVTDGDKGDVTVSASGATWTIDNNAVTNAKAADMAEATIKGRQAGGGTGDPEDLTAAQARTAMSLGTMATQAANNVAITGGTVDDVAIGATTPDTARVTGLQVATAAKTANYTATSADSVIYCDATGGAFTITLPAAASQPGRLYTVKKTDASANAITVDPNGAETIDGFSGRTLGYQYGFETYVSDGTNWRLVGNYRPQRQASSWVRFNGTGVVAIVDEYNVASITDNAAGDYTVNFALALADADYSTYLNVDRVDGGASNIAAHVLASSTYSINAFRFMVEESNGNNVDCAIVSALTFGGHA